MDIEYRLRVSVILFTPLPVWKHSVLKFGENGDPRVLVIPLNFHLQNILYKNKLLRPAPLHLHIKGNRNQVSPAKLKKKNCQKNHSCNTPQDPLVSNRKNLTLIIFL